VGCILNISSNHIDFHGCFDEYINSKINILKNLSSDNVLVYNSDDKEILKHITKAECKLDPVTLAEIQNFKYKLSVEGTHNIFNAIFAAHIVKHLGIDDDTITRALGTYQPLPHRIEFVDEINGVSYYDDSKSTTVASTIAALNSLGKNKNIILLAGGHDKGNDYSSLLPYKNIVKIICIGRDNQKLLNTFGGLCVEEIDMFKAVQLASQYAKNGDIVLLSTMCASYDVYNNFEERGNIFKEAVHWWKQHSEIL
jgi:UDP-N-acetylmuramoylalanine--D-glutamate ligase